MEFLIEEVKLKETLRILDAEILNYIGKRKYISEYIVNYRKKILEEYRDDDDKVIDFFDHESYVKEEAFKTIDKRLKEFTILKENRDLLDEIATILIDKETLFGDEFLDIVCRKYPELKKEKKINTEA